jgi:hypothetical protein
VWSVKSEIQCECEVRKAKARTRASVWRRNKVEAIRCWKATKVTMLCLVVTPVLN